MHLKSLLLAGLVTSASALPYAAAHSPSAHLTTQQVNTAQAVFAIQTAVPTATAGAPLAAHIPMHQVAPRFVGTLDYPNGTVIGGTVLAVLVLGMWFGRCHGSGRKE